MLAALLPAVGGGGRGHRRRRRSARSPATGRRASRATAGRRALASLNQPRGTIATGPDGSLFIADTFNNRIRRVAPDGTISTVAGNGVGAYGGDNGPALTARLHWPHDVDVDAAGNVWIADSANHRIRMVSSADGVIRTVVGTGSAASTATACPGRRRGSTAPKGVVITATTCGSPTATTTASARSTSRPASSARWRHAVPRGSTGDGGPAIQAPRSTARGMIALDSVGNLYIADSFNHRIRRVGTDGIITTVAGTGVAGFAGDGGPATLARLSEPRGITLADDVTLVHRGHRKRPHPPRRPHHRSHHDRRRQRGGSDSPGTAARPSAPACAIRAGCRSTRPGRLLIARHLNNRIRVRRSARRLMALVTAE